jgi:cholest-4-en-3-one 26-monooxygenase
MREDAQMAAPTDLDAGFNLLDPLLWEQRVPFEEFATLRRTAPVWWNTQSDEINPFKDGGLWAITAHEHVSAITRDNDNWSTNANGVIPVFPSVADAATIEPSKALLVNHDPPSHTRLRQIVSRLFTSRAVGKLEEELRRVMTDIVQRASDKGSGDFVEDVAAMLPIQAIADLIGIPPEDRDQVFEWANSLIGADDDEAGNGDPILASAQLLGYAYQMAEDRRRHPKDDIVTLLVNADIDGESMTELEFGYFVVFLAVAGNETTRNAAAHGMNAFLDHPEQWELFKRSRPATTADEIIRLSSPVVVSQRTALHDVVVGDVTVEKGQRVGLYYASANYDEDAFHQPETFDIARSPNPHVGFGGNGPHFCLGASLARLELRLIFDAVADIIPNISKANEPRRLRSALINGITRFDVSYG